MTLEDLKKIVDSCIDELREWQAPEGIKVLITTQDPSIGARASSDVRYAGMGMDWEGVQFRLEPSSHLITEDKSRTISRPAVKMDFGGVSFMGCQRCGMKVAKSDAYCRHCGQKL